MAKEKISRGSYALIEKKINLFLFLLISKISISKLV